MIVLSIQDPGKWNYLKRWAFFWTKCSSFISPPMALKSHPFCGLGWCVSAPQDRTDIENTLLFPSNLLIALVLASPLPVGLTSAVANLHVIKMKHFIFKHVFLQLMISISYYTDLIPKGLMESFMTTHYVTHRSSRYRARCVCSVPLPFPFSPLFSWAVCVNVCVVYRYDIYPHMCSYGGPRLRQDCASVALYLFHWDRVSQLAHSLPV